MTSEKGIFEQIKNYEVVNNVEALQLIKNEADGIADNRIAERAQEAINRVIEKVKSVENNLQQQTETIKSLDGSPSETEKRTNELNQKIEKVKDQAEQDINAVIGVSVNDKETTPKITYIEVVNQFKNRFGEKYFIDESLQEKKEELKEFLKNLRNSVSNPDIVNEAITNLEEESIENLFKNGAVQAETEALFRNHGNNPSGIAIQHYQNELNDRLGYKIPSRVVSLLLRKMVLK